MTEATQTDAKLARQKRLIAILGVLLVITGLVVLIVLKRVPTPVRLMAGLGDVFIGCVLLVLTLQPSRH